MSDNHSSKQVTFLDDIKVHNESSSSSSLNVKKHARILNEQSEKEPLLGRSSGAASNSFKKLTNLKVFFT